MSFNAFVVRVFIASPSDTVNARRALRQTLEDWNSDHAEHDKIMLLPVMWERDATPEAGDPPQAIINRQLVDVADMLIGVFRTRLGTPTGEAESGTVEEIERLIEAGKPVMLYFSAENIPVDEIDPEELTRLKMFRASLEKRAFVDTFADEGELDRKVTRAVTRMVREHFAPSLEPEPEERPDQESVGPRARLLASIDKHREMSGFSKSGSPKYRTRERLIIENRGDVAAETLTWNVEVPEGESVPFIGKDTDEPIARLPPDATLEYPLAQTFGTAAHWDIVFNWTEGEMKYEERQTMR